MHRRGKLAELLWPGSDERKGRTALRSALAGLRTALGDRDAAAAGTYVLVEGDFIGLDPTNLELDLRALDGAPTNISAFVGQREQMLESLSAAAAAYRGEFVEEFFLQDAPDFEEWLIAQREMWRRRAGEVLGLLSVLREEAGELALAVEAAAHRTRLEPFDEAACFRLIEILFAAGNRDGALYAYREHRSKLSRELGIEPGPELEALVARVHSGPPTRRPPPRSGDAPANTRIPFVGRSEPFAALIDEYRAACEGQTRMAAVIGEAGIGKSRLAAEFLTWAEAQGADVLRGRAFEASIGVPYGPIVDMIRERIERERAPDDLLDDVWLSELSRLLPELRERYPDLPPPSSDESTGKIRLFEAVARFGLALTQSASPVVLFIDDLQWADQASLELRQYTGRRWAEEGAPILLVSTVRQETLNSDTRLAQWLASVGRDLPLRRLELEDLAADDIAELVGSISSSEGDPDPTVESDAEKLEQLSRWLYEETGGQPFFVVETFRALRDRGVLVPWALEDGRQVLRISTLEPGVLNGALPSGVREVVRGRLSNLGRNSSGLLAAGATLGGSFTFEQLTNVAGLEETEGLFALDETLGTRLLIGARNGVVSSPDGTYTFTHDKIAEVVYTEAGEARKRTFHRRALEMLQGGAAPPADLARHALASGLFEPAFRHLMAAGDEATEVFAVKDAMAFYERAQSLLSERSAGEKRMSRLGTTAQRLHLYERLGRCYGLLRRWGDARESYEMMLTVAREAKDREAEWEALFRLASLATDMTTQPETDGEAFRGVKEQAEREPSEADSRPDGSLAGPGSRRIGEESPEYHQAPERFEWSPSYSLGRAEEALTLARESGRKELVAHSTALVALLGVYSGSWGAVAEGAAEARFLYAALGDRALEGGLLNLSAWGEAMTGEPQEAVRLGRECLAVTGELGNQGIYVSDLHGLPLALLETGDYEEALSVALRGLEAARSLGSSERLHPNLLLVGDACKALFRPEESRAAYTGLPEAVSIRQHHALTHSKLCALAALEGDWQEAYIQALQAAELKGEVALQLTAPFHFHSEVEALLRGGEETLAHEELKRFVAAMGDNRRIRILYLRARAVLERWQVETGAATESLRQAETLAGEIGLPGELWQIRADLGELHEERGENEAARRWFHQAADSVKDLAGRIGAAELREGFLSAPQVRRVLDKA